MLVKKSSVDLKYIFRTSEGTPDNSTLPTDLSILRNEKTGRLLTTLSKVLTRLTQMEMTALSPDPKLSPGTTFPWLGHVRPTPTSLVPMLIDKITSAIFQESLRRTPNHKVAGSYVVPDVVLKHMPLAFQALVAGITPLYGSRAAPSTYIRRGTRLGWTTTAQSPLLTPFTRYGLLV